MPETRLPLRTTLPYIGVGGAMLMALLAAMVGPALGGRSAPPPSTVVAERTISFADRPDGAVVVLENNKVVDVFQGEQGFVRGTLRAMARGRRLNGLPATAPFHLTAWADGRLTLDDTANGQRLDLEAFGPTNAAVFATLLPGLVTAPGAEK